MLGGSRARGCTLLYDFRASPGFPGLPGPHLHEVVPETPALHPQFMSPEMAGPIWAPFPLLLWPLAREQGLFVVPSRWEG